MNNYSEYLWFIAINPIKDFTGIHVPVIRLLFEDKGQNQRDTTGMMVVTTTDALHDMWDGGDPWKYEGAINRMVGRFINSLPTK